MKSYLLGLVVLLISFCFSALAQVLPVDASSDIDWGKLIGEMIANPKALSAAFIGALIVLIIVQLLKSQKLGSFFKFLDPKIQFAIVTLLGQVYAIVIHSFVLHDLTLSVSLIGVFSSGGAVAIFNAFKLVFAKSDSELKA